MGRHASIQLRRVLEGAGHRVVHVVVQHTPESRPCPHPTSSSSSNARTGRRSTTSTTTSTSARRAAADARARRPRSRTDWIRLDTSSIILEQPFLVDVVSAIVARSMSSRCLLVRERRVSTQAVISNGSYRIGDGPPDRIDEVRELEARAIELASHVTAICPSDRAACCEPSSDATRRWSQRHGGRRTVARRQASSPGAQSRRVDFIMAGSAYWPNVRRPSPISPHRASPSFPRRRGSMSPVRCRPTCSTINRSPYIIRSMPRDSCSAASWRWKNSSTRCGRHVLCSYRCSLARAPISRPRSCSRLR